MNRLREFRQRAYLTQKQLAKRANVTSAAISCIELGKSYPKSKTQKKIATALNISQAKIIFGKLPLSRQRPLYDPLLYQPVISRDKYLKISCRRCHYPIMGLTWNPAKYELVVRKMSRLAKVHSNGFFYHEDCLKEKLRIELEFPDLPIK